MVFEKIGRFFEKSRIQKLFIYEYIFTIVILLKNGFPHIPQLHRVSIMHCIICTFIKINYSFQSNFPRALLIKSHYFGHFLHATPSTLTLAFHALTLHFMLQEKIKKTTTYLPHTQFSSSQVQIRTFGFTSRFQALVLPIGCRKKSASIAIHRTIE